MTHLINGKTIAAQIQNELLKKVVGLPGRKPCLAMVLVGDHPPSKIYVARKEQACQETKFLSIVRNINSQITEFELLSIIKSLNEDKAIDGILVQLPLPGHINPLTIALQIAPEKDVDGLNPVNAGKLLIGDSSGFVPCTPLGIKVLLEKAHISVEGKHVVILGRSNLVGKPLAALLMQNAAGANATVTVAHSQTRNLTDLCRSADVLVAAIGKPRFLTADMVKEGVVVVDVGINQIEDPSASKGRRIVGDVDFDSVKEKCSAITPVPGGVGPMTIAMLLSNTWKSFVKHG
jgi:methylenetetrahydrofolate dehydrogenase (NADP+)/methenyltetrahydrofolate cyclohydrolase